MKALIESKSGEYFCCVIENGDTVNIHENDFEDAVDVGDIVSISITKAESK